MNDLSAAKAMELLTAVRDEPGHPITPDDKSALTLAIDALAGQDA